MIRTWYGAGLIAGIAVFLWGGLAHMVLGLGGESTMKQIPNETTTLAMMASTIKEPGLYMYPHISDPEKMAKAIETQPYGLLIYSPAGTPMSMGPMLGKQAVGDILACLLAAWLFSMALPMLPTLVSRVGFVLGLGLFSFLVSEVPYWNWYRFPGDFTMFALAFKLTTGLVSGLILATLMGRTVSAPMASRATAQAV
jgi:hypothetical protein